MERIKQAIEKARAEREGQETARPQPARQPAPAANPSPAAPLSPNCKLNRPHLEASRIVAFDGNDPKSMPFDMLRTRLVQKMRFSSWHSIGVTSPRAECGKTVTAINLAMSLARQPDQRVVLADLDFRKPHIARYLGFKPDRDVHSVLNGDVTLEAAFSRPDVGGAGLRILANTSPLSDASAIVHSNRIQTLMSQLKQNAGDGFVVIDLPPVLAADDVISMLPQLDCLLMVVAAGETTPAEIEESERLLQGANSIDIVLNKSDEADHAYYY